MNTPASLANLCVYCGSKPGKDGIYLTAAAALGLNIAQQNLGLVYGGASIGLMGKIADSVLQAGGSVTGVIPTELQAMEIAHHGLTHLEVVADMHARKAQMERLSQGFIAMPGGLGTLEEWFEILTWAQLGTHTKPCALYNINGYYDGLIEFTEHAIDQGFINPRHTEHVIVESDPIKLIQKMKERIV